MAGSATPAPGPTAKAVKPIKFVNNEGRPPAKRRRINAACQTCRKRKIRCDGKKPICSTCTENGHTCLGYTDSAQQNRQNTTVGDHASEDEENGENWPSATGKFDVQAAPRLYQGPAVSENISPSTGVGEYAQRQPSSLEGPSNRSPMYTSENRASPTIPTQGRRVPFFRYFGPTAIVPGYKQMVVSLRDRKNNTGGQSGLSPASGGPSDGEHYDMGRSSHSGSEPPSRPELPFYDQADPTPVNSLIRHLVEIFFTHVGCNFPFLLRDKFEHMVAEKKVEAILVNAVCALAARFSDHPLLTRGHDAGRSKSDYGSVYAQRAKNAVIDTFPCPTVAAVQACLLLGYESFGADQDSALWMYTGCAIRMAVDLGLQKIDGVKGADSSDPPKDDSHPKDQSLSPINGSTIRNTAAENRRQKAIEQERSNTLWAVLMLDRVISAGTGRPVSLRNEDFELSFPEVTRNVETGWPAPFPALIQMINLYGRVSDLLNNTGDASDLTQEKMAGLSGMENEVTQLYQKLDPRLTFNAANFQHYVKCGEGTNFILLHFWFHTLIMLLHQPMLLRSVHGGKQQIMPNSRELSMSSAKTVADILAFAELIDPKSFVGNPFTCQPMYTAACAFLMESRTSSQPGSRGMSPPPRKSARGEIKHEARENGHGHVQDLKTAKQNYLAAAANQNYQRCYNGLVQLQTYWGGTKYIITALDQRAKGIWDPETFTTEEMASTKLSQSKALKDWKSRLPANVAMRSPSINGMPFYTGMEMPGSPLNDPNQLMGWSLTGTTNSPSSNLAFLYQSLGGDFQPSTQPSASGNMVYDPIRQSLPENTNATTAPFSQNPNAMQYGIQNRFHKSRFTGQMSPYSHLLPPSSGSTPTPSISDAEMLLGLQQPSPFSPSTSHQNGASTSSSHQHQHRHGMPLTSQQSDAQPRPPATYDFAYNDGMGGMHGYHPGNFNTSGMDGLGLGRMGAGEMMIESQDIDMSAFGTEMMPWLEFLPQDVLGWGDGGTSKEEWP